MGKPGRHGRSPSPECIGRLVVTPGKSIQYPQEEKAKAIPLVVVSKWSRFLCLLPCSTGRSLLPHLVLYFHNNFFF